MKWIVDLVGFAFRARRYHAKTSVRKPIFVQPVLQRDSCFPNVERQLEIPPATIRITGL